MYKYLDVGFPVGRNTPYKYIIINIHYLSSVINDKSGNQLMMSRKPYVHWFLFLFLIKSIIF